jgi:hypothetical protein
VLAAAGLALAFALFAAILGTVGTTLFLGEWLFGSMGWGILQGLALAVAAIATAVEVILLAEDARIARHVVVALVIGILLGIVFLLNLTHDAWSSLASSLDLSQVEERWQVAVVAIGFSAAVLAVIGALIGAWKGRSFGAFLGGLFAGALLGVLVGAFTAVDYSVEVAVALGILAAYVAFSVVTFVGIARHGVDPDVLKSRFVPEQTIASTKETFEWLQAQAPGGNAQ